jgi:hypothetical protein
VDGGIPGGYLDGMCDLRSGDRPHRDNQRAVKGTYWSAGPICAEHGNIASPFEVTHWNAAGHQCPLKREATAQQKGHAVLLPSVMDVLWLLNQFSIFIDTVPRQVCPQISILTPGWIRMRGPRICDLQHRARFGIAHAEAQEVESLDGGQDDQVGLGIT